jgi:hypothetical protein
MLPNSMRTVVAGRFNPPVMGDWPVDEIAARRYARGARVAKRRGELGLDIGFEDSPVHRRVDDEGRGEGVATQSGDEGLGLPMFERGLGSKALALQAASARACHFGGGSGLVEEDQPVVLEPHLRLPFSPPFLSRLANVGAIAFAGQKRFF